MKKIKTMSLLLSLGLACVGNQMYASAPGEHSRRPVAQGFAHKLNRPIANPAVEHAALLFGEFLVSKATSKNTEELTKKFTNFISFVDGMSENGKKCVSTVILSSPVTSVIANASISTKLKLMMAGNFLSRVCNNIESVEWDIDVNNCEGTLNLYMKNIPTDVRIMIASSHTDVVQIQGNKMSYSF